MTVDTMQMPRANPRQPGPEERAAKRIEHERTKRGWSTAELARRMTEEGVPVNQSSIYKIEKGSPRRTISLDEAHALVSVFGLESIYELESIPEEIIGADVARYVDELGEIEDSVGELRRKVGGLLGEVVKTAEAAQPIRDYLGAEPPWAGIDELRDELTELAAVIIQVRDMIARLRPSGGSK